MFKRGGPCDPVRNFPEFSPKIPSVEGNGGKKVRGAAMTTKDGKMEESGAGGTNSRKEERREEGDDEVGDGRADPVD